MFILQVTLNSLIYLFVFGGMSAIFFKAQGHLKAQHFLIQKVTQQTHLKYSRFYHKDFGNFSFSTTQKTWKGKIIGKKRHFQLLKGGP
jgi:hypothetical protein